jgi:hypothetical protein
MFVRHLAVLCSSYGDSDEREDEHIYAVFIHVIRLVCSAHLHAQQGERQAKIRYMHIFCCTDKTL